MAADPILISRVDELIALFNRRSMDIPDGLLDRRTQFLLNGTPFEAMLGRAADDPLVLMIARGPAGYRFAIKALQHALPDARASRGDIENSAAAGEAFVVSLRLSGHIRGEGQPLETDARIRVSLGTTGAVARADAAIAPAVVEILRQARLRD
jgi:hypothetical protein